MTYLNGAKAVWWAALAAAAAVLLSGCSDSLKVVTEPDGALVVVHPTDVSVKPDAARASGASFSVDYKRHRTYTIRAEPPPGQQERFKTTTRIIDAAAYNGLVGPAGRKELRVRLDDRDYRVLSGMTIVFDPVMGVIGVIRDARGYLDTAEGTAAAPTKLVEFGERAEIQGMSLSADGRRILFSTAGKSASVEVGTVAAGNAVATTRLQRIIDSQMKAVAATAEGGTGVSEITTGGFLDFYPSYTPDGDYILFSSNRRRQAGADLLRIRASDRGAVQDIQVDAFGNKLLMPNQSTDGTIVYTLIPPGTQLIDSAQVWTIGGPNQFPTQVAAPGYHARISPDGEQIAFIRDGNLWVCRASGGGDKSLTSSADSIIADYRARLSDAERDFFDSPQGRNGFFPNGYPSWTPDGKWIVWTSMQGRDREGIPQEDIWAIRADGTGTALQLTTNFSADRFPLVSPGSRWIYFYSNRGGRWGIWRIPTPDIMR